jgi:hypothetical protein
MNVSAITSSLNTSSSQTSASDEASLLEKQKANLQKEIQKIQQGNDDDATKEQRIKQIQLQIQLLDTQILQKESSKTEQQQGSGQKLMGPPPGGKPPTVMESKSSDSAKKIDVQV